MAGYNWNNVSMLTPGMKNLGSQINRRFAFRSPTSDGAVGDYAHSQGSSGHNPDDTSHDNAEWDSDSDTKKEIRAIDVDKDLNDSYGIDMQEVINHMIRLPGLSIVIRYIIYRGKIYHVRNGFAPETYIGDNKHTEHAHFSGAWSQASDENTSFDFKFDQLGVDMPVLDGADVTKIWAAEGGPANARITAFNMLSEARAAARSADARTLAISQALVSIAAKVDLDPSEIDAIKNALPTAQETAEAVVGALSDNVPTLADLLREALTPEALAALKAELNN